MEIVEKLSNVDYEKMLLSCLSLKPEAILEVDLNPDDFYRISHQEFFKVLKDMYAREMTISFESIFQYVRVREDFEMTFGGPAGLIDILNASPAGGSKRIQLYSTTIKSFSKARQALNVFREAADELQGIHPDDIQICIDRTGEKLMAISEGDTDKSGEVISKEMFMEAFDELMMGVKAGIKTGFQDLDKLLVAGLQPGDLVVVAGRPSMGKTAFALNIATYLINHHQHVMMFSLETKTKAVLMRMIQSLAGVGRKAEGVNDIEANRLMDVAGKIMPVISDNLFINEGKANNVDDIVTHAKRNKFQHGDIGLIIVDHLQLIRAKGFRNDDARGVISYATAAFKRLAVELNCPVLCLSQLNRGVESREDKRPRLSDLKESGSIEQDADIIMMLYRDEYYHPGENKNRAEVAIQKQRDGATGIVQLMYLPQFMRFVDAPAEWTMGESVKDTDIAM